MLIKCSANYILKNESEKYVYKYDNLRNGEYRRCTEIRKNVTSAPLGLSGFINPCKYKFSVYIIYSSHPVKLE